MRKINFVLVPGAWCGAWAWQKVAPLLREAGHTVSALTLTGLGDRRRDATTSTNLTTHVEDVAIHMEMEGLDDVTLAIDSIPAIFGITRDAFIVYTSNVFAILGLRALYFLLAGFLNRLRYLTVGLAFVLSFIGGKMIVEPWLHVPPSCFPLSRSAIRACAPDQRPGPAAGRIDRLPIAARLQNSGHR